MSTESVKQAIAAFDDYCKEKRNYGTWDSEPIRLIRSLIQRILAGKNVKVPKTANEWQIYSTVAGAEIVAQNMHNLFSKIVEEVGKTTVAEANSPAFKNAIFAL